MVSPVAQAGGIPALKVQAGPSRSGEPPSTSSFEVVRNKMMNEYLNSLKFLRLTFTEKILAEYSRHYSQLVSSRCSRIRRVPSEAMHREECNQT